MRKAPTVLAWSKTLADLRKRNCSLLPSSAVSKWNSNVPKSNKIIGNKAVAVSNVMALPAEANKTIMTIAHTRGSDKVFSDDNLSSKKLRVGYNFKGGRSAKSKWSKYGLVNEECLI
eukprot:6277095-Karenia_brevis.AAC.1